MTYSRLAAYLALTLCAALPAGHADAAKATAPSIEFVREGFCISPMGTVCNEVLLPNVMVDIRKLPKLKDGTPVLYFYSEQKAAPKTLFAHILEAEDVDAHVDYQSPERGQLAAGPEKKSLEAMVKILAPDDGTIVIPYHTDSPGQSFGVASYIPVTVPGAYHGSVVDMKGAPLPGSKRITVTIIRRQ